MNQRAADALSGCMLGAYAAAGKPL